MKSKQNDAQLIAEAYAKVEVQEEALGAIAAGAGRGLAAAGKVAGKAAAAAGKATGKALTSGVAKKAYKAAGKAALKTGEAALKTAGGALAGAVGGAVSGAADGLADAVSDEEKEDDKVEAKITKALATGGIDKSDAAQIRRMNDSEDAEHEAPVEVDMSQNPDPKSLEVVKVEEPVEAPAIHPDVEDEPRVNHHDDSEMKMALSELYKIEKYAFALGLMMKELPALEGWTAAKITKAADYLGSVFHKLDYDFASGDHADVVPSEDHEGH